MEWKNYTEQDLIQSFELIINRLIELANLFDGGQKSFFIDRLNTALTEYKTKTEDPRRLFRPAALKLANTAKSMSDKFSGRGISAEAAEMSNLAFEVYRSFRNEKYLDDISGSIMIFAQNAPAPAITPLSQSINDVKKIIQTIRYEERSSVESHAYEGVLSCYDKYLNSLVAEGKEEKIKNLITTNYQSVIEFSRLLGNQILLAQKWTEHAQQYTPELFEAIGDSNPQQYSGLDSASIKELQKFVQQVAYQKAYEVLQKQRKNILSTLQSKVVVENKPIIEPPLTIKDKDSQVETMCQSAIQQRSRNVKVAIQLLREAQMKSSTNWRILEWLGALYLRSDPPNYLQAKQSLETIPPTWKSVARDWNLAVLYCKLDDASEKLKAFELIRSSFAQDPRMTKLYFCIELAILLGINEYLIENLESIPVFEGAAYGFILSYENGNKDNQAKYLFLLDGYLSDGNPEVPDKDANLSSLQIEKIKNTFMQRRLLKAGIVYFEDLYRKNHNTRQGAIYLDVLIELLENNKSYDRVVDIIKKDFEFNARNGNITQGKLISEAQDLLRYCKEHNLADDGFEILNKLSHLNILLSDNARENWRTTFEKIRENQVPEDDTKRISISPIAQQTNVETSSDIKSDEGNNAKNADQAKAMEILASTNPEISRFSTWAEVIENKEKIQKSLQSVLVLIGSDAQGLVSHWTLMLEKLEEFRSQSDVEKRRALTNELAQMQKATESKIQAIKNPQIGNYIAAVRAAISKATANAASKANALPSIELRILNKDLTNRTDTQTTLIIELENITETPVDNANLSLELGRRLFSLEQEDNSVPLKDGIPPKSTRVISYKIRRNPEINGDREVFNFSGTYESNGMKDLPLFDSVRSEEIVVRAKNTKTDTKVRNPYISTGSVPADKVENFHGRDDLLQRVNGSIADQEAREALFINGIRRVGKTSILNKLEAAPPDGIFAVTVRLDLMNIDSTGAFFHSLATFVQKSIASKFNLDPDFLGLLSPEKMNAFKEYPQIAFPEFLESIKNRLANLKLLLMFDEFQIATEAIQRSRAEGTTTKLDIVLLDMLRGHIESRSFLALFTGSSLFSEIQDHLPGYNRLWGSLTPLDIGFVDSDAVEQILSIPAKKYHVKYTDSAIQRVYDYSQGYPWFVQLIGTEVIDILNSEDRLVVSPSDIDVASYQLVGRDHNFDGYWWNKQRFDPHPDGIIINTILDKQAFEWVGVPMPTIVEAGKRLGLQQEHITQRISKLRQFHIIDRAASGLYRIKALVLEKWLQFKRDETNGELPFSYEQKKLARLAIVVDHENIWFGLARLRSKATDLNTFLSHTSIDQLVATWNEYSQRYGKVVARYSVAEWHNESEIDKQRHQQVYRTAGFETPLPIMHQQQAADNEIKQRITDLQIKYPEIDTYILALGDGDYANTVDGLLNNGKEVIIWSLRDSLHNVYDKLKELRNLKIEYIEDILSLSEF